MLKSVKSVNPSHPCSRIILISAFFFVFWLPFFDFLGNVDWFWCIFPCVAFYIVVVVVVVGVRFAVGLGLGFISGWCFLISIPTTGFTPVVFLVVFVFYGFILSRPHDLTLWDFFFHIVFCPFFLNYGFGSADFNRRSVASLSDGKEILPITMYNRLQFVHTHCV